MGKYFGTDGFRGEANVTLGAEDAFRIGRFLGWYFQNNHGEKRGESRILIGKDPRRSSHMLEHALVAGITASGGDAYLLHETTTPAVSYVTNRDGFDCGVMISASHNPYYDNGIKLLNGRGEKMEEETLSLIEAYLDGSPEQLPYATGEKIGTVVDHASGEERYIEHLLSQIQLSFHGMKVGLDCANGGAWKIARRVFRDLGAETYVIHGEPDGLNINRNAGSTHMESLCRLVKDQGLDMGVAFDGDGDRCLCVDEKGAVVTGDHILYLLACEMKAQGKLDGNRVVTTVMSNLGLYKALEEQGILYAQTQVGDKYVYDYMIRNGCALGGEQSGHIIIGKSATTGDGILTGLMVTELVRSKDQPMSKLCRSVKTYPQVLKNISVISKEEALHDPKVLEVAEEVAKLLGGNGRILLRASGTEPLIRVMVEAPEEALCRDCADRVIHMIHTQGYGK